MARLRNFETKIGPRGFRAVLFRMVPKLVSQAIVLIVRFRAVLFRMVPKLKFYDSHVMLCFRAVLFRMVPKLMRFLLLM